MSQGLLNGNPTVGSLDDVVAMEAQSEQENTFSSNSFISVSKESYLIYEQSIELALQDRLEDLRVATLELV